MEISQQDIVIILFIILIIYILLALPLNHAISIIAASIIAVLYIETSKEKKIDNMIPYENMPYRYKSPQIAKNANSLTQIPYSSPPNNWDLINAVYDESSHTQYDVPEHPSYLNLNGRGYNVDEQMARMQSHISDRNRRAINGAVRATRNKFDKFFEQELRENETRHWWENEYADYEEMDRPYV